MRKLKSHKVNGLNEAINILVLGEPGAGGACHEYACNYGDETQKIRFQNGPIAEAGVNGISQEALLAIVEDRLVGFQSGPYANQANEDALENVRAAMNALHSRTRERGARGVEGTSQP